VTIAAARESAMMRPELNREPFFSRDAHVELQILSGKELHSIPRLKKLLSIFPPSCRFSLDMCET
jgi:hypothetical protein